MRIDVIVCRKMFSRGVQMMLWELDIRESVRQTLAEFTGGTEPLMGPAAIEAGLLAAMTREPNRKGTAPTHVRHHVSSVRFGSVARDRVVVSSYFAVHTDIGLDHWGRYRDELIPADDQWLFARRRISVDAFSPGSLMAG